MRPRVRRLDAALPVLLVAVLIGCRGCGGAVETVPTVDPQAAPALALFQLTSQEDCTREQLGRVIDPELLDHENPALLDALERLGDAAQPEIVGIEPMPGLDRTAVDLRASLPGEGSARYSVQTARLSDGSWRVVWFRGPGVDWPERPIPRGPGLASSAPPEP